MTTYICCACERDDANECGMHKGIMTPCACDCHKADKSSGEWWQSVAEAKQEERDRYREALEQIEQFADCTLPERSRIIAVLRTARAALAGAELRDVDTVEAVAAGKWKPKPTEVKS